MMGSFTRKNFSLPSSGTETGRISLLIGCVKSTSTMYLFVKTKKIDMIVDKTFSETDTKGDGKIDTDEWKPFVSKKSLSNKEHDPSISKVSNIVLKELGNHPKVYIWTGEGPNPHMGHLAWADAFIVTADSVSMLSEACSTGKPVYVVGAERCTWKFVEFHKTLRERGLVRPFTGLEDMSETWSYPPLNDTAEAAHRIHEALADRGWRLRP